MTGPILRVENLVKRFGGLVATNNLSFDVAPGTTHAIIGPNGAGKSTLIAQLQGEIRPNSGRILFDGRDITRAPSHGRAGLGIARTFQITSLLPDFTVFTNVAMAVQVSLGHSFAMLRPAHAAPAIRDRVAEVLATVHLDAQANRLASELSHGERRQLELAVAIAMRPRLLLLDEPLAGMGRSDSARVVELLDKLKAQYTILLVEHDMDAVFRLADAMTVLVFGEAIATGTPAEIRDNAAVRSAYLGHA